LLIYQHAHEGHNAIETLRLEVYWLRRDLEKKFKGYFGVLFCLSLPLPLFFLSPPFRPAFNCACSLYTDSDSKHSYLFYHPYRHLHTHTHINTHTLMHAHINMHDTHTHTRTHTHRQNRGHHVRQKDNQIDFTA